MISNEGDEPPLIHVRGHGKRAKFWLLPVSVAHRGRFADHELHQIERIIHEHHDGRAPFLIRLKPEIMQRVRRKAGAVGLSLSEFVEKQLAES